MSGAKCIRYCASSRRLSRDATKLCCQRPVGASVGRCLRLFLPEHCVSPLSSGACGGVASIRVSGGGIGTNHQTRGGRGGERGSGRYRSMESDAWNHFSAVASKRHQAAARARYTDTSRDSNLRCWRDVFLGFEQLDGGEEEHRPEYSCPFCSEDFDMVGLCCHFDEEHPVETKNGVCPICAASVGLDLVRHLTMQHGNYFKMQRRKKLRRGSSASQTMLSVLRKDLKEGNLQVLLGGSSYMSPAHPMAAPDLFISSLMYKLPLDDSSKDARPESLDEGSIISKSSAEEVVERVEPPLSDKDQRERAQRSEFVQGLVLSTIFDDIL